MSDLLCWDRCCLYSQSLNTVSCSLPYHRKARNPYQSEQMLSQTCFPKLTARPVRCTSSKALPPTNISQSKPFSQQVRNPTPYYSALSGPTNTDSCFAVIHAKVQPFPQAQQSVPPNWHPQVTSSAKRYLPFLKIKCSS